MRLWVNRRIYIKDGVETLEFHTEQVTAVWEGMVLRLFIFIGDEIVICVRQFICDFVLCTRQKAIMIDLYMKSRWMYFIFNGII